MQRAARCVAAACPGPDGSGAGPAKLPQPPAGGWPPSSVCVASDSRRRHSLRDVQRNLVLSAYSLADKGVAVTLATSALAPAAAGTPCIVCNAWFLDKICVFCAP